MNNVKKVNILADNIIPSLQAYSIYPCQNWWPTLPGSWKAKGALRLYVSTLLVNTLVDVYKIRDLEWATGEMSHLKVFLSEQLNEKKKELSISENELKEFQKIEKIFGLDENS